jgi:hypothetical protein
MRPSRRMPCKPRTSHHGSTSSREVMEEVWHRAGPRLVAHQVPVVRARVSRVDHQPRDIPRRDRERHIVRVPGVQRANVCKHPLKIEAGIRVLEGPERGQPRMSIAATYYYAAS